MSSVNSDRTYRTVPDITQVRIDVNSVLENWYSQNTQHASQIHPTYGELWQSLQSLGLAGGKRLRPYLTVISYMACGGDKYEDAIIVGAGEELLHTSLLIHDDIIDHDFKRYGQPNVAGVYQSKYRAITNKDEADHFATSAAILAGDLALSGSHQLILQSNFSAEQKLHAMRLLDEAIFAVAGGELLDAEASLNPGRPTDSLIIAELKTASYSFMSPLILGATLANASSSTIERLGDLGKALGTAYQLSDDLLGLYGDEATTGKPITSDIREGKQTFLLRQILENASREDAMVVTRMLGNPEVSIHDIETIRTIATQNGARSAVEKQMRDFATEAQTILAKLGWPEDYTRALSSLIEKVLWRNA